MPIQVNCECGAVFRVKDELAGKSGRCPKCGERIQVPGAAPPPLDFADEEPGPAPPAASHERQDSTSGRDPGEQVSPGREHRPGVAAPSHRQPIRSVASRTEDSKSVWKALGQAFYNPFRAFDNLGYHILSSQTQLASVLVLFVVGFFATQIFETVIQRAKAARDTESEDEKPDEIGFAGDPDAGGPTLPPLPIGRLPRIPPKAMASVDRDIAEDGYAVHLSLMASEEGWLSADLGIEESRKPEGGAFWRVRARIPAVDAESWTGLDGRKVMGNVLLYGMSRRELAILGTSKEIEVEFLLDLVVDRNGVEETLASKTYSIGGKLEVPANEFADEEGARDEPGTAGEDASGARKLSEQVGKQVGFATMLAYVIGVAVVYLAVKALAIDLVAGWATGARRFLQLGVVLLFLEGVTGIAAVPLAAAGAALPKDVALYAGFLFLLWRYVLLGFAVSGVYDTPWYGFLAASALLTFELLILPLALGAIGITILAGNLA